jgi:DNA-binding winged helix-turn-helix (wHTH) protein/tetratricopeptide (TPR) repeat protein
MNKQAKQFYAFGPFRLNPEEQLLFRDGQPVSLAPKVTGTLLVLIENSGHLVDKDDLMKRVWPDAVVEEGNLNKNISVLRKVLGQWDGGLEYIETVPKRGYRFVAPVTSTEGSEFATGTAPVPRRRGRNIALAVSFLLSAGLLAGGLMWRGRQARVVGERNTIVLGDFANSTGDGIFDGTLRQGLSVELAQSPYLKLESEKQIRQTLRMMGKEVSAQLTPEIAREVCQRSNSAAALDGSIALIGNRYELILNAVDCASGDLLASTKAEAKAKSDVLEGLDRVASEMRKKLGESVATVRKYNTPLVQATTASLEALQFYTLGQQTITQTGNFTASLASFQKAIELDPSFAMAYFAMGDAYSTIGETALSAEYVQKAFNLRARMSQREKLVIEGVYYYYALGDLIKAQRSFELLAALYPGYAYAHVVLGAIFNALGQYEAGLREYQEALRLEPFSSVFHRHVALTNLLLNRVDDAAAVAKEAHAKGLDSNLAPFLYAIAFYQGDPTEMARQVARAGGKAGEEDLLLGMEGDTAAYFGHLERALGFTYRAAQSAERTGAKETAATYYAVSALREALLGDGYNARLQAKIAKRRSTGRDMDYGLALALAYAGDTNGAQALADDLENRFPQDTIVQLNYVPTVRARLAINHANPQQALDLLRVAGPYELGLPAIGFYNWPNLYPVYVRGEAYLAAHRGGEAAAEFQRILDRPGIVLNEPISALTHLQLGRAYEMSGDTNRAKTAYQDFLTLWKDADSNVPILKQVKAEYAKLQ